MNFKVLLESNKNRNEGWFMVSRNGRTSSNVPLCIFLDPSSEF